MDKPNIKLIIFDAYGVYINAGYPNTSKYLAKKYHKDWKYIQSVMYVKYFNQAALKQISQAQAWQKTIDELNIPLTVEQLKKIHYGLMKINPPVLALARKLKNDYKIILLSKNTREQFRDLKEICPELQAIFGKNMINAWEHNLPKASKETVNFLCKKFKTKPQEILYFDDQMDNLKVPKEMGVNTILYKNFRQCRKELNKYIE